MSRPDYAAIATARERLSDALSAVDAAAEVLRGGGLTDLARDLHNTAGGLRHFAGPEGVMAWVEKGEGDLL